MRAQTDNQAYIRAGREPIVHGLLSRPHLLFQFQNGLFCPGQLRSADR
jgi:hypothetical protein